MNCSRFILIRVVEGIIGWLIGIKAGFAWLFPLKSYCKHSQAVFIHILDSLNKWGILLKISTEAIITIIMSCFGGYYRNLSGIIRFFQCAISEFIHSNI